MENPRSLGASEVPAIAKLWWRSWHDGHAEIVPTALVELRTYDSFLERAENRLGIIRVIGPVDDPLGMCYVVDDEMQQLFVSSAARGKGIAGRLLHDAEKILKESGVERAWLACAIGNDRAEKFYGKSGWDKVGTMIENLETSAGIFKLETWRFEKKL